MHPKLGALLDLWNRKRAGRRMPARDDFDVFELREWLGSLHLVEVIEGGRDFLHRIYGTDLAVTFDIELTGKGMDAIPPEARQRVRRAYEAVYASGEPLLLPDDPILRSSMERVEDIILPLSSGGTVVDRLLIGAVRVARERTLEPAGPGPAERRREMRVAGLWRGVLQRGDERESCVVLDHSSAGARLQLESPAMPGEAVTIAFDDFPPRPARMVWQAGGQAGVEFIAA